jgi:hypothetical protein
MFAVVFAEQIDRAEMGGRIPSTSDRPAFRVVGGIHPERIEKPHFSDLHNHRIAVKTCRA